MVASVVLVEARPRAAATGLPVVVRFAGAGAVAPYRYGGEHWQAGLAGLPKSIASLDFDGEQLGGGGVAQAIELAWTPSSRTALAEMAALFWTDASIVVRVGPEGGALPPVVTTGLVLETAIGNGALKIALADQAADLKRPLLVDRFAGTGGIEGPAEFADLIKSRAWGACFNVPGRQIHAATNVWCFGDPRRPWKSFDQVRDKGVAPAPAAVTVLAWQGSAEATFAALQATPVVDGGGVFCPSIACVKWWTEPAGDLHADIRGETAGGYVETASEIAARIVAARSTITFAGGEVAAAALARPAAFGWRVDSDSATAAGEISELLSGVSLSWLLIDGTMAFRRWDWTAPARTARSFSVSRRSTVKPTASRKLGYRRNWSPMARGDLAAIVLSSDVIYDDGTPMEDLKPATPGATAGAPDGTHVGGTINPDGSISGGVPARDVAAAAVKVPGLSAAIEILADTPDTDQQLDGARSLVALARSAVRAQLESQLLAEERKSFMMELTHTNGVRNGTIVKRVDRETKEGDRLLVESVSIVSAAIDATDKLVVAEVGRLDRAIVDASGASAEALVQVRAAIEEAIAGEIIRLDKAVVDASGASAEALVQVRAAIEEAIAGEIVRLDRAVVDAGGASAEALAQVRAAIEEAFAGEIIRLDKAVVDESRASAEALEQVSASFDGVSGRVDTLTEVVIGPEGADARAMMRLDVNGRVSGTIQTNDGALAAFGVLADMFGVYHPVTGALLFYVDVDGAIAANFKRSAIGTDNLAMGAVQKAAFYSLASDVIVTRGAAVQVVALTFVKEDADSILEITFNGDFSSPDDLQFIGSLMVDATVVKSTRTNIILVNANAQMPITPFVFATGISAGEHTVTFIVSNVEADSRPLTIAAGSTIKVVELRKGSIGSSSGSGAVIVPGGGGYGGGGGGGHTNPIPEQS